MSDLAKLGSLHTGVGLAIWARRTISACRKPIASSMSSSAGGFHLTDGFGDIDHPLGHTEVKPLHHAPFHDNDALLGTRHLLLLLSAKLLVVLSPLHDCE
jgi:hypothetical protein